MRYELGALHERRIDRGVSDVELLLSDWRAPRTHLWPRLEQIEPKRSRIELFDMVWWMYFRRVEPVGPQSG